MDFWRLPSARACAALFCAATLADLILVRGSSLSIAPDVYDTGLTLSAILGALATICLGVEWRLKNDADRAARIISSACRFVVNCTMIVLAFVLLALALGVFCFASNALALPLQDATFDAIDRFFGVDWLQFTSWVSERPLLAQALAWSYFSCMNQIALVVIVLLATGRVAELWDFLTVIMFGLAVTLLVAALLPAASPAVYLQPDPGLVGVMKGFGATYDYIESFAAIRSGAQTIFTIDGMRGIITFPSYHVVVALSIVYAVRHWALAAWPFAALNLAVIVSAVPIGGHYAIDIVGGVAVFMISVAFVKSINHRRISITPPSRRFQLAEAL